MTFVKALIKVHVYAKESSLTVIRRVNETQLWNCQEIFFKMEKFCLCAKSTNVGEHRQTKIPVCNISHYGLDISRDSRKLPQRSRHAKGQEISQRRRWPREITSSWIEWRRFTTKSIWFTWELGKCANKVLFVGKSDRSFQIKTYLCAKWMWYIV